MKLKVRKIEGLFLFPSNPITSIPPIAPVSIIGILGIITVVSIRTIGQLRKCVPILTKYRIRVVRFRTSIPPLAPPANGMRNSIFERRHTCEGTFDVSDPTRIATGGSERNLSIFGHVRTDAGRGIRYPGSPRNRSGKGRTRQQKCIIPAPWDTHRKATPLISTGLLVSLTSEK